MIRPFDVIQEELTENANTSFIKGNYTIAKKIKDINNDKLDLEIQFNGIIKFSERLNSIGIDAITLAQGIGTVLKSI